jgi:3-methyl-2-oxobutanoate hydroxymethyltransferase
MSRIVENSQDKSRRKITVPGLRSMKNEGSKITMVTCYDAAFGRIIEACDIDVVLVGDSLGNVVLGFDSTIPVTMAAMLHHTAAVTRSVKTPLVCADMPFLSYATVETALQNAGQLIQLAGAQAVKLEGGTDIVPQVKSLVGQGIPVMGHLGLTPQSIHAMGSYRVQGRDEASRSRMKADAKALEEAGAFALVLEMVPADLSAEISKSLNIPVIGIGAGSQCDGQVLVLHDLLGFQEDFNPKFLKKYANLGSAVRDAVNLYSKEVKSGAFPDAAHSFQSSN